MENTQNIETLKNEALVVISENELSLQESNPILECILKQLSKIEPVYQKAMSLKVTDESQVQEMLEAKQIRSTLKEIRIAGEKERKALKEESLRKGQCIDKSFKKIEDFLKEREEYLETQEKFIEIKEKLRLQELENQRKEIIKDLQADTSFYDLKLMPQDAFDKLVFELKSAKEAREVSEKLEKEIMEKEAQGKEQEVEKQKEENEKLRKEAQEKEAQLQAEREQNRKLQEEKEVREKEESDKKAQEEKKRLAEEKKLSKMGDKEKVQTLLKDILSIKLPAVQSEDAINLMLEVSQALNIATKAIENYE
jgi:hypothetical protein